MASIEKEVTKFWWNIYGSCFAGTHFTKKNALIMSTGNNIPSGSVFTLKKNILSKIVDKSLIFKYATLEKLENFPKIKDASLTATPPCNSEYSFTNSTAIDVYGKLIDGTNIGKINAELQTMLKKSKTLKINISEWGIDYIEEGSLELFLQKQLAKKDATILKITDGEHYIATEGICIKGMSFSYELDKEVVQKIKAIYEDNSAKFIEFGVTINISSETSLTTDFEYKEKFYPFLKFRKIKTDGNIKGMIKGLETGKVILEDIDINDEID